MALAMTGKPVGMEEAMLVSAQGALFDYEMLDAENRIVVQQRTTEIREIVRATAENVIKIGAKLADVRDRLGGRFIEWLALEFAEWSERTAYNFIAVYQTFGARDQEQIAKIATSALYLLSAPSTPPAARQAALEMAEDGEHVTHKAAKVLVEAAKEAEPKTGALFEVAEAPVELSAEPQAAAGETRAQEVTQRTDFPFAELPASAPTPTPKRDKLVAEKAADQARKLWSQSNIQIGISLMPEDGDSRGRQAIVSVRAGDGAPVIQSKRIQEMPGIWPKPIDEMFSVFAEKLAEQKAEKRAAKPATKTKKPAAKAARKSK